MDTKVSKLNEDATERLQRALAAIRAGLEAGSAADRSVGWIAECDRGLAALAELEAFFAAPPAPAAPPRNDEAWLREKAAAEDGCFVSVGGLVTDLEQSASDEAAIRTDQRRQVTYLATPYSHPDPAVMQARFEQACAVAGALMAKGELVFSPIAHTHPIAVCSELPRGWDFWRAYDYAMLASARRVLVVQMDGWRESKGIAGELEIACELGIPVEYMAAAIERGQPAEATEETK